MSELKSGLDPRRRPNLLGIGAAKCGTTWFAKKLSDHPDIFMPPQKELGALYYNDLDNRLAEYEDFFRGAEKSRYRCDFSVRYLSEPNAPSAAARHTPDARILVILRDPVDQVQSHYWHHVRQNFSQARAVRPLPDIFEAIQRFPQLLIEPALYGKHLRRWREYFADDRILLLSYDEVTNDLPKTLARVCEFLDLPPMSAGLEREPTRRDRGGVAPRGGLLGGIYPTLYTAVAHGPYQAMKRKFGVRQVDAIKRHLKLRQISEAIFFKQGYKKLGPAERKFLRSFFADDLVKLHSDTGFLPAYIWQSVP